MRIDLHCHSKYSHDNYFEPRLLIREAIEKKLDGVCFTEHYSFDASLPVEQITVPDGFYVFRGVEISTNMGHLLVYGLEDDTWNVWSRDNYLDCMEVMERVFALGGICIPAHPFRGQDSFGDKISDIYGWNAIETHNGLNTYEANRKAINWNGSVAIPQRNVPVAKILKPINKVFFRPILSLNFAIGI